MVSVPGGTQLIKTETKTKVFWELNNFPSECRILRRQKKLTCPLCLPCLLPSSFPYGNKTQLWSYCVPCSRNGKIREVNCSHTKEFAECELYIQNVGHKQKKDVVWQFWKWSISLLCSEHAESKKKIKKRLFLFLLHECFIFYEEKNQSIKRAFLTA